MTKHDETILCSTGVNADPTHGAVIPPLYLSANYSFDGYGGKRAYDYTRSGNPTRDVLAEALTALEGGAGAVITSSGMSAVDREVARSLELPTHGAAEWRSISERDKTAVAALRRCRLRLGEDPREWELDLIEVPGLEHHVGGFRLLGLLGWDYLDQCRLSIDGPSRTFSLELPG